MNYALAVRDSIVNYAIEEVAVLRMPLPASYAIPLSIQEPSDARLLCWAFADFDHQQDSAVCLLVIQGPSLERYRRVIVRTHFGDIAVPVDKGSTEPSLSPDEVKALGCSVLAALKPHTFGELTNLLPRLTRGLDSLPMKTNAPYVKRTENSNIIVVRECPLIPEYILPRTSKGHACFPVKTVRIRFDGDTLPTFQLLFEEAPAAGNGRVILTGGGDYIVAQVEART